MPDKPLLPLGHPLVVAPPLESVHSDAPVPETVPELRILLSVPCKAMEEVTVLEVAATGICEAVMPERPFPPLATGKMPDTSAVKLTAELVTVWVDPAKCAIPTPGAEATTQVAHPKAELAKASGAVTPKYDGTPVEPVGLPNN